jgi:hypothetical protein
MQTHQSLKTDSRGVVLLIAVFLASLLVGVMWYVVGVGDAIVHHQSMQDSADGVAYAAAVAHAGGMNFIALTNLIMALVLSFYVLLKLLETAAMIASVFGCLPCARAAAAFEELATGYQRTWVATTLPALHTTATWTAKLLPYGIAIASAPVSYKLYGRLGAAVSTSMVTFQGERDGLPVKDEKFVILCRAASKMVSQLVFKPIQDVAGIPTGWFQDQIPELVTWFPGWFCGSWTLSSAQMKSWSPKKIYDPALAGNDYFAVWSFVGGNLSSSADTGIGIGALGSATPPAPGLWTHTGFAKAEFYYDIGIGDFSFKYSAQKDEAEAGPHEEPSPQAIPGDSLWNLRWRARLRRFRPPIAPVGSLLANLFNNSVIKKIEDWFGKTKLGSGNGPWVLYTFLSSVKNFFRKMAVYVDSLPKQGVGLTEGNSEVIH